MSRQAMGLGHTTLPGLYIPLSRLHHPICYLQAQTPEQDKEREVQASSQREAVGGIRVRMERSYLADESKGGNPVL